MDPTTIKIADTESETPPRSLPVNPLSFTNGTSVKKHHHPPLPPFTAEVVAYKECLKNHVAIFGSHALDGCGKFMPSPNCTAIDPTSLKCAACGCHRNFHHRNFNNESPFTPSYFLEFHQLSSPPPHWGSSPSLSPPRQHQPLPISYAPNMLLALSTMVRGVVRGSGRSSAKSRRRRCHVSTFAEKLSWKMPGSDDKTVSDFC